MDYEREQARLLTLWEEAEDDAMPIEDYDDDEFSDEEDKIENREEDSESEQDLENEDEITPPSQKKIRREPMFLGRDNLTEWKKHKPSVKVRTRSKNIVTHLPGVKGPARSVSTVIDCWKCFFDENILNIIVDHTNHFISEKQYSNEYRTATPTDLTEMKALLGLLYLAAVRKVNNLNCADLWKTNGTSIELFRLTMSLERFRFLIRHIRFDNKRTREDRQKIDKLAAIREMFEIFVTNCKNNYTPSEYTTVDEMLAGFKGKCNFRQYIPSKPNKYGIKIFALVDAKMFYTQNLEVYVGKQPDGPFANSNSGQAIVERMVEPIVNSGRNVTVDNWFTSIELCESLLEKKLTVVGTIKKNKRQIPREFVEGKNRSVGSSMFGFHKNGTLVSFIPKKGKNVLMISTMHDDDTIDVNTGKPEMIMMYNDTKGGVDVVDKLCAGYDCARATRRWPMVIFYRLLNVAGTNAFVVFNSNNPDANMLRRHFLENLSFALIEDHVKRRLTIQQTPRTTQMRIREILNIKSEAQPQDEEKLYGRCTYCGTKKSRKTKYKCKKCTKFMCLEHINAICGDCLQNIE